MPVTREQVQRNYAEVCEGVTSPADPRPRRIADRILTEVGLVDERGNYYRTANGTPRLNPDRKKTVADYPLGLLAEAIIGPDWPAAITRQLSEEAVAPIGPSYFANVNAYLPTVAGLVQAAYLEGYGAAEFDLVDLFPSRPYQITEPWTGGSRIPAIVGPAKPAPKVGPGESHPDYNMAALWVETGPMAKYGGKISIARETAVTDIQGGIVTAAAAGMGTADRYRQNELTLDVIVGTTNNFKLGLTADTSATGYNTYGATVPTGNGTTAALGNDMVNPMADPISTFQASDSALTGYKHPLTGLPMPMTTELNTLLVPQTLNAYALFLNGLADISILNQPGAPAPAAAGTFPTGSMTGRNPFAGRFTVRVSQWLYNRHILSATQTDPDVSPGLGLSAANANRWYRLNPAKFAMWRVAWPFQRYQVSPQSATYADQGLAFMEVVDAAYQLQVMNPWMIQRNKVA